MARYVLHFDLRHLASHLSHALKCNLTDADVREMLQDLGLVESSMGWLAEDLRPLALAYIKPGGWL